jgi:hypothetical protein
LGLGGAGVTTTDTLPARSPVALVIDAPHLWDPLILEGAVAWIREPSREEPARLGLKFLPRDGVLLRRLLELLELSLFD